MTVIMLLLSLLSFKKTTPRLIDFLCCCPFLPVKWLHILHLCATVELQVRGFRETRHPLRLLHDIGCLCEINKQWRDAACTSALISSCVFSRYGHLSHYLTSPHCVIDVSLPASIIPFDPKGQSVINAVSKSFYLFMSRRITWVAACLHQV